MGINRFYTTIALRIVLISLTCLVLVIFIMEIKRPVTTIFFALLIIFQTIWLIQYVNRTNRELAKFLIYLKEKDTSLALTAPFLEKTFEGLMVSFKSLMDDIQSARIEKEQQFQYMKILVEHLNTGLLSFNEKGDIEMVNQAACRMLHLKSLTHLNQLTKIKADFPEMLLKLKASEQNHYPIEVDHHLLELSIRATQLKIGEKNITLVSFQDIRTELDKKEIESWQKLIRILRHEILNSITPITTLTVAIQRRLQEGSKMKSFSEISEESLAEVVHSTEVIQERSKGLLNFIQKYRNLSQLPVPEIEMHSVKLIFEQVKLLYQEEFLKKDIIFSFDINPADMIIPVDKKLFEQVLINLVKNAIEASETGGYVRLEAAKKTGINEIKVLNKGIPIAEEDLKNIFIPFFTTRKEGSGIGLSLSKQIVQLLGGTISVWSKKDEDTCFTIELPSTLL
jgi:two-component system, NtrC family, nitrogen regulation sensor histidine kinase NtrY